MSIKRFAYRLCVLTFLGAFGVLLLSVSGCQVAGYAASTIAGGADVSAAYGGLKDQRVGVMVWADAGVTIDHPSIISDIANSLQGKLKQAASAGAGEVKNIKWESNDEVYKLQESHPEFESIPPQEIATKLPVSRLIYIEVISVSTHPNEAVDLLRGSIETNLRVIEVTDGVGKVGYQADGIRGTYPEHSPPEGAPNLDEQTVYRQSINAVTTQLAKIFVTHEADAK